MFGTKTSPSDEETPAAPAKEETSLLQKASLFGSKVKEDAAQGFTKTKEGVEKGYATTKETVISFAKNPELKAQADKVRRWLKDGPLALKLTCFAACFASMVVGIFSIITHLARKEEEHKFMKAVNSFYGFMFAFLGCLIEGSSLTYLNRFKWTKHYKSRIEHWAKFLQRVWGRGIFYLFASFFWFGQYTFVSFVCGCALFISAIACFWTSYCLAGQMNKLSQELLTTYQQNMGDFNVKEEALHKEKKDYVKQVFDKMDTDGSGYLDPAELAVVAKELGAEFSNEEMMAIFSMIDEDGNGEISFDEFAKWWFGAKMVKFSWL